MSYRILCAALFCAALVGCSDDAGPIYVIGGDTSSDTQTGDTSTDVPGADAGDDVSIDADEDADDASADVPLDGGGDAGDTSVDALEDAGDTTEDSGEDVNPDVVEDTAPDVDVTPPAEVCDNDEDDDEDGDTDCDDDDCADHRSCVAPGCGNGVLDDDEDCEDGNTDDGDGCASDCSVERGFRNECGDGVIVAVAGEECDDGGANSDEDPDACRTDCVYAYCGDDVVDAGESCDGEATCDDECEVVSTCGNGAVEAPEVCDDGNDNPGDGCDMCLLTAPSSCGDGVYAPAFEECEGGRGCEGGDICSASCECEAPEFCGNGSIDDGEECDGSDTPCGANGYCDACACEEYVCGNNVREGTEECDGSDDSACGSSETCSGCACTAPDVAPRLDAMPSNPVSAGAVTYRGWDMAACDDVLVGHQRVTVTLTGRSSAPLASVGLSVSALDIAQEAEVTTAAGDFDTSVTFCLPEIPEGETVRMVVTDTRGRESTGVNWTFPTLRRPTLTGISISESRAGSEHVLRLTGSAPDRNVRHFLADLAIPGGPVDDFEISIGAVSFNGTQYTALALLAEVDGVGITRYDGEVVSFGGLATARLGGSVRAPSGSGGECVPSVWRSGRPMCSGTLVCRTTGTFDGECVAPTGGAPSLTAVTEARVIAGSPYCVEGASEVRWRMVGSTSAPIVEMTVESTTFGEGEFLVRATPIAAGAFDVEESICINGTLTDLKVRVIDEADRQSVQRTASFAP